MHSVYYMLFAQLRTIPIRRSVHNYSHASRSFAHPIRTHYSHTTVRSTVHTGSRAARLVRDRSHSCSHPFALVHIRRRTCECAIGTQYMSTDVRNNGTKVRVAVGGSMDGGRFQSVSAELVYSLWCSAGRIADAAYFSTIMRILPVWFRGWLT